MKKLFLLSICLFYFSFLHSQNSVLSATSYFMGYSGIVELKKEILLLGKFLTAIPDSTTNARVKVQSFTCKIYHKGSVKSYKITSGRLPYEVLQFFKELQAGDEVIFDNVIAMDQNGQEYQSKAIKITLIN